ncbi:MAG: hypothetical protein WD716_14535 [Fimbriimonadaceae bacterium]
MKRVKLLVAILVLLACGCSRDGDAIKESMVGKPATTTTAQADSGDSPPQQGIAGQTPQEYSVTYTTEVLDSGRSRGMYWGAEGGQGTIVQDLKIVLEGEPLPVWRSAFCDLANVRKLEQKSTEDGLIVTISGGDDGSPYVCTITIVGRNIVHRSVASRIFPENHNEETSYTNTAPDN